MSIETVITKMPKVELHVHLEGSVRPETLLKLAKRHQVALPADDIESLRKWYTFRDFNHFIEIYMTISSCLRTSEDIELIAREFLIGQAEQNIRYSEVTFTPFNQYYTNQLGFHAQIDAVNRARAWALERCGDGLIALGLGGPENDNPPEKFQAAFDRVRAAGLPCILHAGETVGPPSIWSAIRVSDTVRIGHGVRAVENPQLMDYLRETQIPL